MRGYTRAATAVVTLGLAVSMAACSSSGNSGGSGTSSSANSGSSQAAGTGGAGTTPKAVGAFTTLTGNSTTVALAPAFLKALTSLGVTPATVGTATLKGADISFPITGGHATIYPYKSKVKGGYVQGIVDHDGSGLSLSAGGTTVTLENFVINPGSNSELTGKVLVNGKVAYPSVKLFDLDGSTLKMPTISSAGVATLTGTTVYVSQAAAGALNSVFKLTGAKALPTTKDAIEVGIATIKATGK